MLSDSYAGSFFWLVHRRQRVVRAHLLDDLRTVLADIVNNQLIAVRLNAQKISSTADRFTDLERHLRMVDELAKTISDYVNLLSEESIRKWNS